MSTFQIAAISATFLILFAVTGLEMGHRLPAGRIKAAILMGAGFAMVGLLFAAGIPSQWFSGDWPPFVLGAALTASSFAGRTPAEESFRRPLLGSVGVALIAANVAAHV